LVRACTFPPPATKKLHDIKSLKPDLISRAFACAVYINATSTPDQKNRTSTQKRGFAGNGVHQTRRLLVQTHEERGGKHVNHVLKTPLWRSTLMLDTDDMLRPVSVQ
jgi:hypothetical protein